MNRILLKESIANISNSTYEAINGKQAIEIFEKEEIDIILMDIEMPVMNGIETTKYIRENFSNKKTIIIAITAHNPAYFLESYKNTGFDNVILKPYSISKILRIINSISN